MPRNKYYLPLKELNKKTSTEYLFLAEGDAEVGLIEACLNVLGADPKLCTVLCFEGVSKLVTKTSAFAKILAPTASDLERIKGICLVADSDQNPSGRVDTIIECAKALGFERSGAELKNNAIYEVGSRRFSYSLSPSNVTPGRIEDIILQESADDQIMSCIDTAAECIERLSGTALNTKAKVQMFICAKANNSVIGIGRAFDAAVLDVNHGAYGSHIGAIKYILRL